MKFIARLTLLTALLLPQTTFAVEYLPATPQQLNQKISSDTDKVRLLFFFTSWCSVCKQSYAELIRIEKKYRDKNLSIYAISLDEDTYKLKRFMGKLSSIKSNIYHIQSSYEHDIGDVFRKFNIRYSGTIPHIVVLDQNGRKIADGGYDLAYFDNGLDQILK